MKELLFAYEQLDGVLTGRLRMTIRQYREEAHAFKEGDHVLGKFGTGVDVVLRITANTVVKPFCDLSNEEARENGYPDASSVLPGLMAYYTDLAPDDDAGVIRFCVPKIDGVPTVKVRG